MGQKPKVYLQGSYRNHTNIRGDSDVDIVVEASNIIYDENQSTSRRNREAEEDCRWFKSEFKSALINYYGYTNVSESSNGKCIKVSGSGNRLNADVVPCVTHRHFSPDGDPIHGITFWTNNGTQIVNYPKLHLENGAKKNKDCEENFKPIIRVFKNARNAVYSDFPSYFLECLLYNIHYQCFSGDFSQSFPLILQHLTEFKNCGELKFFDCQNELQGIFGPEPYEIDIKHAYELIKLLNELWERRL